MLERSEPGVDRLSHEVEMSIIKNMKKKEAAVQRILGFGEALANRYTDGNALYILRKRS